jgi:hypothetical protein
MIDDDVGDSQIGAAVTGYERWIGRARQSGGMGRRATVRLGVLVTLALAASVAVIASGAKGIVPGAVLLAGFLVLLVTYLIVWRAATVAAHRALIRRAQLGKIRRLIAFVAFFFGFPLLTVIIPGTLFLLAIERGR